MIDHKMYAIEHLFGIKCEHALPLIGGATPTFLEHGKTFVCTMCGETVENDYWINIHNYLNGGVDSHVDSYFTNRMLLFLYRYGDISFFGVKPGGMVNLCVRIKGTSVYFYSATSTFAEAVAFLSVKVFDTLLQTNAGIKDNMLEVLNGGPQTTTIN